MRKTLFLGLTVFLVAIGINARIRPSSQAPAGSNHGLRLILKQEAFQHPLQSCLDRYPPIACIPFRMVLKNEGNETILRWFSSCPSGFMDASVEIQHPDGTWDLFPHDELIVCSSNVLGVAVIAPGESFEWHLSLADPSLQLDTELPSAADKRQISTKKGYALVTGQGQVTVRANWSFTGCVAAHKDVTRTLGPFDGRAQCNGGKQPQPNFVVLQSNEIRLGTEPLRESGR
jgi:hypothetical protein